MKADLNSRVQQWASQHEVAPSKMSAEQMAIAAKELGTSRDAVLTAILELQNSAYLGTTVRSEALKGGSPAETHTPSRQLLDFEKAAEKGLGGDYGLDTVWSDWKIGKATLRSALRTLYKDLSPEDQREARAWFGTKGMANSLIAVSQSPAAFGIGQVAATIQEIFASDPKSD